MGEEATSREIAPEEDTAAVLLSLATLRGHLPTTETGGNTERATEGMAEAEVTVRVQRAQEEVAVPAILRAEADQRATLRSLHPDLALLREGIPRRGRGLSRETGRVEALVQRAATNRRMETLQL